MNKIVCTLALMTSLSTTAAPFSGADCVLFNKANFKGNSITAFRHQNSATVAKLRFTPEGVFLASGSGIKLFTKENFYGDGFYLNESAARALTVQGGVYIRLADVIGSSSRIVSFACVDAGLPFPGRSPRSYFNYWNDKIFVLDRSVGDITNKISLTVTYRDSKKLITVTELDRQRGTNIFVMDVDSYEITLTHKGQESEWTRTMIATNYPNLTPEQQLMYIGAAAMMREAVSTIYHNKTSSYEENIDPIVPNLELETVLNILSWQNRLP